jgi:hypothetical protein
LNGPLWNKPCLRERGTPGARLPQVIFCQEEILNDQTRLGTFGQAVVGSYQSTPENTTINGLMIVAVFLVGIGIGDILSKSKQANTNYAAMIAVRTTP